jgi:hypothetical protein
MTTLINQVVCVIARSSALAEQRACALERYGAQAPLDFKLA